MKSWSKFRFAACLLAVLLVSCVPAFAEDVEAETVLELPETADTGGTGETVYYVPDYPDFWVAHVEAPEGEADLNTIAAVIMFGFGSVCGLLAGSEVVRKWTL